MSANLFRNVMLGLTLTAMLLMAVVAYGRFRSEGKAQDDCCLRIESNHNSDLPWEALATQWFRSVSL